MGKKAELSQNTRKFILSLHSEGQSSQEIRRLLKIRDSTVRRVVAHQKSLGTIAIKPRSGWPRKTSPRQERHLKALSLGDRFKAMPKLRPELEKDCGARVSACTVCRRLQAEGLRGSIAAKKPFISQINKKRLAFAREHKDWRIEQWSDGAKFCGLMSPVPSPQLTFYPRS